MNTFWKVWIVLLTVWVIFQSNHSHSNWRSRDNSEAIENLTETVNKNVNIDNERYNKLIEHINGPLRDELNEMRKYLHKH